MIQLEHQRSRIGESLEARVEKLENLDEAHSAAIAEIVRQNADINLDPGHEQTVIRMSATRISVGSEHEHYAGLMHMDGDEVAEVYHEHLDAD